MRLLLGEGPGGQGVGQQGWGVGFHVLPHSACNCIIVRFYDCGKTKIWGPDIFFELLRKGWEESIYELLKFWIKELRWQLLNLKSKIAVNRESFPFTSCIRFIQNSELFGSFRRIYIGPVNRPFWDAEFNWLNRIITATISKFKTKDSSPHSSLHLHM